MVCKRFGKPHIKLWNNELVRMFGFVSLPKQQPINKECDKNSPSIPLDSNRMDGSSSRRHLILEDKVVECADDLDSNHLSNIMNSKVLLPFMSLDEIFHWDKPTVQNQTSFINPLKNRKPISIETALIYGEPDRFYYIIDPKKDVNPEDDDELKNCEIIGL